MYAHKYRSYTLLQKLQIPNSISNHNGEKTQQQKYPRLFQRDLERLIMTLHKIDYHFEFYQHGNDQLGLLRNENHKFVVVDSS